MSPLTPIKPAIRRAIDKVAQPYMARIDEQLGTLRLAVASNSGPVASASEPAASGVSVSDRFHMTIHELRTLELERLNGKYERVLSVGANGSWYFDWFEQSVGEVAEHVGVEAYEPMPSDLPRYVRWVTDTADHMDNVRSESVDLVFAGQTTEHLWAEELVGFLLEANRVLRPEGRLVLDSPNRLVTEHLLWSHGGHTVELDAAEISELVTLAGFDVDEVRGIWHSTADGTVLPLEHGCDDPVMLARRVAGGQEHPDGSFIWWLNARRSSRSPDPQRLEKRAHALFREHWATRISRGFFSPPDLSMAIAGHVSAETLPFPLHAGEWELRMCLARGTWDDVSSLRVALVGADRSPIYTFNADGGVRDGDALAWRFHIAAMQFTLALVLEASSTAPVSIAAPLGLECVAR